MQTVLLLGTSLNVAVGAEATPPDDVAVHFQVQTCLASNNFTRGFWAGSPRFHYIQFRRFAEEVLKLADTRQLSFLSFH